MAKFEVCNVITPFNLVEAKVGRKYWCSDNLLELKRQVDKNLITFKLVEVVKKHSDYPFRLEDGYSYQFLYPYEDTSEQGMTNLQIAEWLAAGNGQWKYKSKIEMSVCTEYMYDADKENAQPKNIVIRPFGTDTWVKPTVAIYERDCCSIDVDEEY